MHTRPGMQELQLQLAFDLLPVAMTNCLTSAALNNATPSHLQPVGLWEEPEGTTWTQGEEADSTQVGVAVACPRPQVLLEGRLRLAHRDAW